MILAIIQTTVTAQSKTLNDPKMGWWKEARFGMFIHWGLYSVPAGVWNGKAPFGYKNVTKNGKAAIDIDETEFVVGAEIFQLYSTGNYGYEELTKLIKERVPGRTGVTKRIIENCTINEIL